MKMTMQRRLILRQLERGAATTRQIRDLLDSEHYAVFRCLSTMAGYGVIKSERRGRETYWKLRGGAA